MNQLRPTVNVGKIQIPTGYEQQQREAANKRRLAETLLAAGLTPEANQNNYAQLFGKLAQTFVGKRLEKQATQAEVGMQQGIRQDYLTARDQLMADVQAGKPASYILQTYGSNPLLKEELKPFEGVWQKELEAPVDIATAGAKDRNSLVEFGGRMVPKGSVAGQYANSPTSMVHANPDGTTMLNPVAVSAAAISQGNLVPEGAPQTTGRIPGVMPIAQVMAGMQQPQQPAGTPEAVDAQGFLNLKGTMTPGQLGNYLRQGNIVVKVNTPEEVQQLGLPPGTKILTPEGPMEVM